MRSALARREADETAPVVAIALREDDRGTGSERRDGATDVEVSEARERDGRPMSESELYNALQRTLRFRTDCKRLSADERDSLVREAFLWIWHRERLAMPSRAKVDHHYIQKALGNAFDAPLRWKDAPGEAGRTETAGGHPDSEDGCDMTTGVDFSRPLVTQAMEEEGAITFPRADAAELAAAMGISKTEARAVVVKASGMKLADVVAQWPDLANVDSAQQLVARGARELRRRYPEPRDLIDAIRGAAASLALDAIPEPLPLCDSAGVPLARRPLFQDGVLQVWRDGTGRPLVRAWRRADGTVIRRPLVRMIGASFPVVDTEDLLVEDRLRTDPNLYLARRVVEGAYHEGRILQRRYLAGARGIYAPVTARAARRRFRSFLLARARDWKRDPAPHVSSPILSAGRKWSTSYVGHASRPAGRLAVAPGATRQWDKPAPEAVPSPDARREAARKTIMSGCGCELCQTAREALNR